LDNILEEYNLAEVLIAEAEELRQTYEEQSIHELLADYTDIIYIDMKELVKTNIIQHTIHLLNQTPIMQECHLINQQDRN